ncbi:MAG: cyclic nucleotide-binding domain-containing protein [Candidatus Dormibacterales bacterium]
MSLLARFLRVRRSELRRTLQVAGFAIVLGWAMYTGFSAVQSIFLNKAGPHAYPLFFIILAFAVWPMIALQGAVTRRFGVGRAFRMNLLANIVLALGVYAVYAYREDATAAFAGYVIYSVAFELVMLHFWSFVSQHFNLLEGKRIFPVIAAGSSVGYILAGVTTTLVAVFATEPLLFVWAFGSAAAALISLGLERTLFRPAVIEEADEFYAVHEAETKAGGPIAALKSASGYLAGSRLVQALVLLALVLQVAGRIGDYLVALVFVNATHNNLQALTILIGDAWLGSYLVQLMVSLFVTPWVLDKLGVKNAITVLPVFTLLGFAAVAVNPVLSTALFLFVVRNGLQTGLDDPAENVLGTALPAQVGPKLKFLLDNVVLPAAAIISGVGLLVAERAVNEDVVVLAVTGIAVGAVFIIAALRVRSLYVGAIYARLRTHALSLSDFAQALGRPNPVQVAELQEYIRGHDEKTRQFAAAALGQAAPDAFTAMLSELLSAEDPVVRRMAFQMAPPGTVSLKQLEAAKDDPDGWVRAALVVAGATSPVRWERADAVMTELESSADPELRAAAVWAASFIDAQSKVSAAMRDSAPRVRLEAMRSFARMKGKVADVAEAFIACLTDEDVEVWREALRQAVRWSAPQGYKDAFATALSAGLASGDRDVRRLASDAMAAQSPTAILLSLPLLAAGNESSAATVEALVRSGRPELFGRARTHLDVQLASAVDLAGLSARLTAGPARVNGAAADGYVLLRIGLDDYVRNATSSGLAAMRALHAKRGFATVERGLRSDAQQARVEALETLLNFGPGWLAEPLSRLLDPESFESGTARPLSRDELEALTGHPDKWVGRTATAALHGPDDKMKELIALKRVPLFSALTLEQLSTIDRLMVTRHYLKGESIFQKGDAGSELFVVLEGEIRVHLDHDGVEVTLARLGDSKVVGEMSVFDEEPRSASAQASQDTTVRVLRRDRMQAIVHEHPELLLEFVKNLSQRLRSMNEQLRGQPVADPNPATRPAAG